MNDESMIPIVVDEHGAVTLPAAFCRRFGLRPGDRLAVADESQRGPALLFGESLVLFRPGPFDLGRLEAALDGVDDGPEPLSRSILESLCLFL